MVSPGLENDCKVGRALSQRYPPLDEHQLNSVTRELICRLEKASHRRRYRSWKILLGVHSETASRQRRWSTRPEMYPRSPTSNVHVLLRIEAFLIRSFRSGNLNRADKIVGAIRPSFLLNGVA
jgi:hypothetical protein